MSRDGEPDPEALADLALRARTERERPSKPLSPWQPSPTVGHWSCHGKCGAMVPITDLTVERWQFFNRMLAKRGDENGNREPLDVNDLVFCADCRAKGEAMIPAGRRMQHDAMAASIRKLKASKNPAGETELLARIRKLGHPDVDAMLAAIVEKRRKGDPYRPPEDA